MLVKLVDCSKEPIDAIARGIELIIGERMDRSDKEQAILDLKNTNLQGPLEHAFMAFEVRGVTRAFTHQLVRYRHKSFSQESLRFVRKDEDFDFLVGPSIAKNKEARDHYYKGMEKVKEFYQGLLEMGVRQEDARGILPINIKTNVYFSSNFRSIVNMAETRLCNQAQKGEWPEFMRQLKSEILNNIKGGYVLNEFLQPICERTKRCEHKSELDRPCPRQEEWE